MTARAALQPSAGCPPPLACIYTHPPAAHPLLPRPASDTALNETARELEMPFGLDPNDLNLCEYQRDFNDKLVQLLDQTIPDLGYQSTRLQPGESTREVASPAAVSGAAKRVEDEVEPVHSRTRAPDEGGAGDIPTENA